MTDAVLVPPSPAELRARLESMLVGNILGPEGGLTEELPGNASVREYYLVGMLAPQQVTAEAGEFDGQQDDASVEGDTEVEEVTPDPVQVAAASLFPSSLGFTFGVDGACKELVLEASWGRYERVHTETEDEDGKTRRVWRRTPAGGSLALPLSEGDFGPLVPDSNQPEVVVRGRVRRNGGLWIVTAFLVNGQAEASGEKDAVWLFQAGLAASDPRGASVFRRSLIAADVEGDAETRALEMAYRDQVQFAVGHGVAVHADPDPSDPRIALHVCTTAVPVFEVPRTDAPSVVDEPGLAEVAFDMKVLSETPVEGLAGVLQPLVAAYRGWIGTQRARIGDPAARLDGHAKAATEALDQCERAAARIEAGIALLADLARPEVAEAFQFANRAMWLQRVHTIVADRRRADPSRSAADVLAEVDVEANRSWRPFQLAFLLVNLPSLADPTHEERQDGRKGLVDLLWFPTGGGKTEAYLGLTAFTLAVRRLQGLVDGFDGSDGVAVLMRYTLRLLTVQQFQRAAALMCACERIRLDAHAAGDARLGSVPFRLGLWVGYSVTPSKNTQAAKAIDEARGSAWHGGGANPVQLTICPWCGAPVTAGKDAEHDPVRKRTLVYCGDPLGKCAFTRRHAPGEGLPVVTVDDELYRLVPAMVISTADKFAQLPWQGPTRSLFGRVTRRCERHGYRHPDLDEELDERDTHQRRGAEPAAKTVAAGPLRPPDLIIQDELHLISGPLGSLMGLYETAIDELASWTVGGVRVRPKVVASTATVRRADEQADQVFWRRLEVFPPPGLDAGDSFFARQRSTAVAPGRRYLGVCAPGRRIKAVEIRLYVALMGAAQKLFDTYGQATDPWMTLVGYFSALRELAGMTRLVDDDVSTRLSQSSIADRGLGRRFIRESQELTSRIDSGDIPAVLDQLGLPFTPPPAGGAPPAPQKGKKGAGRGDRRPIDVLLATNMISVGVDVPRLGLMVVGGQPKSTAEYIQATSRVGRSDAGPGLVVTAMNWARPRDLSHYETFEHFHATFYRHVEALSVTPFAPRALDRGLSGVLTALVRHHDDATNANPAPNSLAPHSVAGAALAAIRQRAEQLTSDPNLGAQIDAAVKQRLDAWVHSQGKVAGGAVLGYRQRKDGRTIGLLEQPGQAKWAIWTCPTSLREVEAGVNLLLTDADPTTVPDYEFPAPEETPPTDASSGADEASEGSPT
ncbi:MAG: DISARM system helicase DrmA [Acidimicrobiia bacterium]